MEIIAAAIDLFLKNRETIVGVMTAITSVLAGGRALLKNHRSRAMPDGQFPFEVIKPHSADVVGLLMSKGAAPDNLLADAKIPYQNREPKRPPVRRALEQALDEKGWLLILGRTGLGKTREAAELAQQYNREGWTILNLSGQEWLDVPSEFASDKIGTERKLLFFLDGLNQMAVRGQQQIAPKSKENELVALQVPFQERLLRVLEFYEKHCHSEEIRVIATARNETERQGNEARSEWDKLERKKHHKLWDRFSSYRLPEPENEAIVDLLEEVVPALHLSAKREDFPRIAERNDGTFTNVVESLIISQSRKLPLSIESFPETLDRQWRLRYKDAIRRYPKAVYLYDSVALLKGLDVELKNFTVLAVAVMLSQAKPWMVPWVRFQLWQALQALVKSDRILEPRDGQIEAKEGLVEIDRWIPQLQKLLLKLAGVRPLEMQNSLMDFAFAISALKRSKEAEACFDHLLMTAPSDRAWFGKGNVMFDVQEWEKAIGYYDRSLHLKEENHQTWFNRGLALSHLKRWEASLKSYQRALEIKPDKVEALDSQGIALKSLGFHQEALESYRRAVEIRPDYCSAWYNQSIALAVLGDWAGTIECCNQVLQVDPSYASAWYNRACAYALLHQSSEAISSLKEAVEINPNKYKGMAKEEADLCSLHSNPQFKALVRT